MLARLVAVSVARPVTTVMITLAVVVFGIVAAMRLPVELLPDLAYPTLTIQTEFPDAAPAEVEELVTRPIEERAGAVPGIVRVESISREGRSEVMLDFAWGTQVDAAMAEVREKLDRVVFPPSAERPLVLRYDPSQDPILRLALRAPTDAALTRSELAALRHGAEVRVERELEKVPGVAAVDLFGGEEDEVLVELDPARLVAHGVTPQEVVTALARDNVNRPGGSVTENQERYLVRTVHEARTPAELGQVIVRSTGGAELRVRDLATVRRAPRERETMSLVDGHEAVELAVFREGDANIVAVAQAVREAVASLDLPPGHRVDVLSDQASFIEAATAEVRSNVLVGGLLAVAVLLFFLRDLRSTAIVAAAIPISLLATFIPLGPLGVTLNLMSLGGLALGVGMLVDNGIVVLEAIARVRESDPARSLREGALVGTQEVASSVFASTATTVAVFLPMAFVEGVAGQLVGDLGYAVSVSMICSMVVALTLVPVLASLGAGARRDDEEPAPRSPIAFLVTWPAALLLHVLAGIVGIAGWVAGRLTLPFAQGYEALARTYPGFLRSALRARWLVGVGVGVLFWGAASGLLPAAPTLLPELDQRELQVRVELPAGASLARTAAVVRTLGAAARELDDVALQYARVGSVPGLGTAASTTAAPHLGQIGIVLRPEVRDPERAADAILLRMRDALPEPGVRLELGRPALVSFAPALEVLVFGEDRRAVEAHAEALLARLGEVPGLRDLAPDDASGRPEVQVEFDRERLARAGLGIDDAAQAVQRAFGGEVATTLFSADQPLDVRVLLDPAARQRVADVEAVPIAVIEGVMVPLAGVAEVHAGFGPSEIRRIDGRRAFRIRLRTADLDLGRSAEAVERVLHARAPEAPDVEAVLSGQAEQMDDVLESLLWTAALSVFLVYVVMASSFESLWHPLLILVTVPLAGAGVVFACGLTDTPLSSMVGIGFIVLAGIVVNNAIVLIHAVNDRRGRGMPVRAAVVEAGQIRLRPIVMTTTTTVLGLLPMALGVGEGAALRQPLAIAVIGGLVLATALTLVVIPCIYTLVPGPKRDAWDPARRDLV